MITVCCAWYDVRCSAVVRWLLTGTVIRKSLSVEDLNQAGLPTPLLFHAQCAPITVRVVRGFIEQPCDARDKLDRAVAEIANVSVCALHSCYVVVCYIHIFHGVRWV